MPRCCKSRPEAVEDYDEDYNQSCEGGHIEKILTCPENLPFVSTQYEDDDSCCAQAPDESGWCEHDRASCGDYGNACFSHPSVLSEGNVNLLIKNYGI